MIAQLDSRYIKTRPTKAITRLISYALFEGRPLTTKGRFINPLVFAILKIACALPVMKKVKSPIFVLGTGRSGTTILGKVLSMHKDVGFLNEPKAMWHVIHSGEDVIGNYTREDGRFRIERSEVTMEVTKRARKIYGAYLTMVMSRIVVDKYPELIFRIPFVKEIFPDARFLFIVRNGWDCCSSISKWSERLGVEKQGEIHDWWGVNNRKWDYIVDQLVAPDPYFAKAVDSIRSFKNHTDMAAVEWIVTMREGMRLMNDNSKDMMLLRYEQMASAPRETMSAIAKFSEFEPDEKFVEYAEQTLAPTPHREVCDLHESIYSLFIETMKELGYDAQL